MAIASGNSANTTTNSATSAPSSVSAPAHHHLEDEETEAAHRRPTIDMDALTEGLMLLTEFAMLDSTTYQNSFSFPSATRRRSSRSISHNNHNTPQQVLNDYGGGPEEEEDEEQHALNQTLRRLEQIQALKSIQATPLPALWRALHRLHSNLAILQENESRHAHEIKALRDEVKRATRETAKLQKTCKGLADSNTRLKLKLNEKRSLLKQAKDLFRSSQELQKDLEQQNTAFKLQAHEQFLLQSSRIRLESTDSNFSDADALLFPDMTSSGTFFSDNNKRVTIPTEEEEDSVSLRSANSSITDEGVVPVLKLFASDDVVLAAHHGTATSYATNTTANTINSSQMSDMSEGSDEHQHFGGGTLSSAPFVTPTPLVATAPSSSSFSLSSSSSSFNLPGGPLKHPASPCTPGVYKLWYTYGQSVGLRFQTIPLHELPVPPKGTLTQDFIMAAAAATEEETPDGSGSFRFPKTISANNTTPGSSTSQSQHGHHPPTIPEEEGSSELLLLQPEDNNNKSSSSKLKGNAFVVAGYDAVATVNTAMDDNNEPLRPTLGARVVEINGTPVDPQWSMRKFLDVLSTTAGVKSERNSGRSDAKKIAAAAVAEEESTEPLETVSTDQQDVVVSATPATFFVGFRNDALTKKQRERLSSGEQKQRERAMSADNQQNQRQRERAMSADAQIAGRKENTPNAPIATTTATLLSDSSAATTKPPPPPPKENRGFGLGFFRLGGGGSNNNNNGKQQQQGQSDNNNKEGDQKKSDAASAPTQKEPPRDAAATAVAEEKKEEMPEEKKEEPPKSAKPSTNNNNNNKEGSPRDSNNAKPEKPKGKNPLFFWDRGGNDAPNKAKPEATKASEATKSDATKPVSPKASQGSDDKQQEQVKKPEANNKPPSIISTPTIVCIPELKEEDAKTNEREDSGDVKAEQTRVVEDAQKEQQQEQIVEEAANSSSIDKKDKQDNDQENRNPSALSATDEKACEPEDNSKTVAAKAAAETRSAFSFWSPRKSGTTTATDKPEDRATKETDADIRPKDAEEKSPPVMSDPVEEGAPTADEAKNANENGSAPTDDGDSSEQRPHEEEHDALVQTEDARMGQPPNDEENNNIDEEPKEAANESPPPAEIPPRSSPPPPLLSAPANGKNNNSNGGNTEDKRTSRPFGIPFWRTSPKPPEKPLAAAVVADKEEEEKVDGSDCKL